MDGAACQLPQEPRIHRAEGELAPFRPLARAWNRIQQPGYLRCGKIGVEQKPRARRDHGFVTRLPQGLTPLCSAPVLPDDGPMDRGSCGPIPHHHGFALIGDADCGDVEGRGSGLIQRGPGRSQGGAPQVLGLVFDPSRSWKVLIEGLLADSQDRAMGIEHQRSGGRGALVESEDKSGHPGSIPIARFSGPGICAGPFSGTCRWRCAEWAPRGTRCSAGSCAWRRAGTNGPAGLRR